MWLQNSGPSAGFSGDLDRLLASATVHGTRTIGALNLGAGELSKGELKNWLHPGAEAPVPKIAAMISMVEIGQHLETKLRKYLGEVLSKLGI